MALLAGNGIRHPARLPAVRASLASWQAGKATLVCSDEFTARLLTGLLVWTGQPALRSNTH